MCPLFTRLRFRRQALVKLIAQTIESFDLLLWVGTSRESFEKVICCKHHSFPYRLLLKPGLGENVIRIGVCLTREMPRPLMHLFL